jgi:hypothetical protein
MDLNAEAAFVTRTKLHVKRSQINRTTAVLDKE